ncbi:Sec-independent protein translocase subunit TatA [Timonella sp. A28]|uniref:Sec-independent protein translocase subunit TatA n=1 Tax=Timonella sp. A28 TaxID=3442640 RepID=UPI003EC08D0E
MPLKPSHLLVLILVLLLLFGAKKLPDLARSVGQSLKIFKKELKDLNDDSSHNTASAPAPHTTVAPSEGSAASAPTTASSPDDGRSTKREDNA